MLLVQDISLGWGKEERGAEYAGIRAGFPMAYPVEQMPSSGEVAMQNLSFWQKGTEFIDCIKRVHAHWIWQCYSQLKELNLTNLSIAPMGGSAASAVVPPMGKASFGVLPLKEGSAKVFPPQEPPLKEFPLKEPHQKETSSEGKPLKGLPLEVTFFYDERRSGKPFRRGHNKDYNNSQSSFYRKDCLNETAFILEEGQYGRIVWNERKIDYDTGGWYYQLHVINLYHLRDKGIKSNIFMADPPDVEYRQMAELK